MKPAVKKIIITACAIVGLLFIFGIGFFLPPERDLPDIPQNRNIEARIRNRIADILHQGGENRIILTRDELNILVNQHRGRSSEYLPGFFRLQNIYIIPQEDIVTVVVRGRFLRFLPMYITMDLEVNVIVNDIHIEPKTIMIGRNTMDRFFLSDEDNGFFSGHTADTFYTINTEDYQVNIKILDVIIQDNAIVIDVRCTLR